MSSKFKTWASRVFAGIITLALVGSATAKFMHAAKMVDGITHAGIPAGDIVPIALLELVCLGLYLIPRTMVLGAVLLTGYFGGAIVLHIIGGKSVLPVFLLGVWVWGGIYFRIPALPSLLPFRTTDWAPASEHADSISVPDRSVSRQGLHAQRS